ALSGFAVGNPFEAPSQHAADGRKDLARVTKRHAADEMDAAHDCSIEIEFIELPVLGDDPAHCSRNRAHHDGFRFYNVLAEFNAAQHRPARDTGRGEEAIALHHILD